MLELAFKFEECPPDPAGPIERYVRGLVGVIQAEPISIPRYSFGRAESIASGMVDVTTGIWYPPTTDGAKRLVAVEFAGSPLLTFVYDDQGRLIETSFLGRHAERYAYDSASRVKAVQWDGQPVIEYGYHAHGGLASIRYADGSMFYYESGPDGLCCSWRYPDGVECFVDHDEHGQIEAVSCGTATVHCTWDRGGRLNTLATATSDGVFRLDLTDKRLTIPFEEKSPQRRGHRTLHSAIGLWTLDRQGVPRELISPLTFRICQIDDPRTHATTRWSPSGQTVWAFKSNGILDSVTAVDGTRTMFIPADDQGHVFALSARGVDVLRYVGGRLAMTRSMDGAFTRLTYGANDGPLSVLESPRGTQFFRCDKEGYLTRLAAPNLFRADGLDALTRQGTIALRLRPTANAHVVLDTVTSWLCNWRGFHQRNRLEQYPVSS